ncbi:MAG: hypothetical protein H0T69_17230 [Thermoleophilaceae bacterium]|nr:hypothetical protein [Thermoleophilaceae bacterium]
MGTRVKETQARRLERVARQQARERAERRRRLMGVAIAAAIAVAASGAIVVAISGGGDSGGAGSNGAGGADLSHIHGLGVNPTDGSLYIATHTGLFRSLRGQATAARVGETEQDVMGFSVLGRDTFLGSGHPGPLQGGPSNLGLIRSDNAGGAWKSVSLMGEADFHVLRSKDNMIYGFNASSGTFMVTSDGGRGWDERETPGAMVDLAIDPEDPAHVVASTEEGLVDSTDAGRTWENLVEGKVALLTWPARDRLYSVDGNGDVQLSRDSGRRWRARGSIGGQPAAFASGGTDLYAALTDASVKRSADGGATWRNRVAP